MTERQTKSGSFNALIIANERTAKKSLNGSFDKYHFLLCQKKMTNCEIEFDILDETKVFHTYLCKICIPSFDKLKQGFPKKESV